MNFTPDVVAKCQEIARRASVEMAKAMKDVFPDEYLTTLDDETIILSPIFALACLFSNKSFAICEILKKNGAEATPEAVLNILNLFTQDIFKATKKAIDNPVTQH